MAPSPSVDAPPKRDLAWQRSSRCANSGCVEIAITEEGIMIRDSKDPKSPVLSYDREEWRAFTEGIKAGEFDLQ